MNDTEPIVFVVDDDPSVRQALARLLRSAGRRVEGLACAEELLERPPPTGPACVVLDVWLPGLDGLSLQRALAEKHNALPIVFLTGHGDVPTAVQAMKGGAADFLTKPVDGAELLAAVERALESAARARRAAEAEAAARQRVDRLSPREREVMALVVQGMLNKQVGHELGVTERTVKAHRARVMSKMGAASLADLVRLAEKAEDHVT
jgi:RNA polymerase sigma factor (sigma-70 family)